MIVLGIETSCDETAAAIVDSQRVIRAERLLSQIDEHKPYGGIVPEIAARSHLDHIDRLAGEVMAEAKLSFADLDGIAATGGPGLIGGVIVGVMTAKAMAAAAGKPFIAVNHLEGHALAARLSGDVAFPYLLLLVSGGHCQLLAVEDVGRYRRLGTTIDDACGEAFDKTAKLLGLGYPGGPIVEATARTGDSERFKLPRPMKGREGCDFSFSGLKTAVKRAVDNLADISDHDRADLCAGFQYAVGDVLVDRTTNAINIFAGLYPDATRPGRLVIGGGVAANTYLRARLEKLTEGQGFQLFAPPQKLCTDNAAMIAWAGIERLERGLIDSLDFAPRPRWPLDSLSPLMEAG